MPLIDKDYRLFGVINPVDLVVVVLVLVAVFAAANMLFGVKVAPQALTEKQTIEVVLRCQGLQPWDPSVVAKGDTVTKIGGGGVMGTLESVRDEPGVQIEGDAQGKPVLSESPYTRDVFFTIRGKGVLSDEAASIGAEQIRVNQRLEVLFPHFQAECRVISIKALD